MVTGAAIESEYNASPLIAHTLFHWASHEVSHSFSFHCPSCRHDFCITWQLWYHSENIELLKQLKFIFNLIFPCCFFWALHGFFGIHDLQFICVSKPTFNPAPTRASSIFSALISLLSNSVIAWGYQISAADTDTSITSINLTGCFTIQPDWVTEAIWETASAASDSITVVAAMGSAYWTQVDGYISFSFTASISESSFVSMTSSTSLASVSSGVDLMQKTASFGQV